MPMLQRLFRSLTLGVILAALAAPAALVPSAAASGSPARAAGAGSVGSVGPAYLPHEVIVGYRPGIVGAVSAQLRMGVRASVPAPAPRTRILRLDRGVSVSEALARLRRQAGVAFAQPDYIAHAVGSAPARARAWFGVPSTTPWNLGAGAGIDAPAAWATLLADHRPGARGVVIAVLDTGVAYRDWKQFTESPDFTGTRFVSPYDFVADTPYPLDRNGHGTFVAGIIAAASNARPGLDGAAYGASIMPVRVLDAAGEGDETTIARGIRYAVNHHAQVINLSLEFLPSQVTSSNEIPEIVSAIAYAHRRGVIVVGAAGNDQTAQIAYPARAPGVISVGATTSDRCLADYSNGGQGLDLVAPGGGDDAILPSDPDCHPDRNLPSIRELTLTNPPHWDQFGYPTYYIGTSMASPEVAATAALVLAGRVLGPRPSPDQVLARLEQTATPLGGSQPNSTYGYGLANAGAATATGTAAAPARAG